jgi:FMN phosphatase YigB (HAD superfamily)
VRGGDVAPDAHAIEPDVAVRRCDQRQAERGQFCKGIGRYIAATHYAHEVGAQKPDPRFYALAVERFDLNPARVLVVGDRHDNDYAPAIATGLHAILVDRRDAVKEAAVLRIHALTDLPRLIEVD